MNQEIKRRVGARVGWLSASWPLASMRATKNEIILDVGLSQKYIFPKNQVISIEPYGLIPIIGKGISIKHKILEYPEKIIVSTLGNPDNLIKDLRSVGFIPSASSSEIKERSGFPIKFEYLAFIVVLWNLLLGLNIWFSNLSKSTAIAFGPFSLFAFLVVFIFSVATLKSGYIQQIVLKEGRNVGEIKDTLRFLALLTGAFSVASLIASVFMIING